MTTLAQLFEFVYTNLNVYVGCGLTLTSNTPLPNPPPTNPAQLPFVTSSLCIQQPEATISASPVSVGVHGEATITFPLVTVLQGTDYWPYTPPVPFPAQGANFDVVVRQYIVNVGLRSRNVARLYFAAINFPWGLVECQLFEDESGVVYGTGGPTMVTMTIGTPTITGP
jgi:hypothetical protein